MSEEVVGIEDHGLDSGVIKSSISEDWEILILIPRVTNNQPASEVKGAVKVLNESSSRNEPIDNLA